MMAKNLKQVAKEISERNGVEYKCVIHMFSLMEHNRKLGTNIQVDDLNQFSKEWKIPVDKAGLILADCINEALEGIIS